MCSAGKAIVNTQSPYFINKQYFCCLIPYGHWMYVLKVGNIDAYWYSIHFTRLNRACFMQHFVIVLVYVKANAVIIFAIKKRKM